MAYLSDLLTATKSSYRSMATKSPRLERRCSYFLPSKRPRNSFSSLYSVNGDLGTRWSGHRSDGSKRLDRAPGSGQVGWLDFDANRIPSRSHGRNGGRSGTQEGIENSVARKGKESDQSFGKLDWIWRGVLALRG